MTMQLSQIAERVGARLIGDPTLVCRGASPPGEASELDITMLDNPKRLDVLSDCRAMAVMTAVELDLKGMAQLIVSNPHDAFSEVVSHFRPPLRSAFPKPGIDPTAVVHETARVHESVSVGAGVIIGAATQIMPGTVILPKTEIGEDCLIHANVTLYEYTKIADRVVIHAGSVIGCHGFGYRQQAGKHIPTAQLGYVSIESDVELGACVTIDRGTYGATRIGEGTKVDNQVMIAHNCRIGRHNLLCSQVGIAGSCQTGDYVVLAGQVGLKDHISLGDHTIVGAQAGVMDDCEGNEVYLGSPATPQREQMQIMAVERRLPEMRRELKQLRRELQRLSEHVGNQKRAA